MDKESKAILGRRTSGSQYAGEQGGRDLKAEIETPCGGWVRVPGVTKHKFNARDGDCLKKKKVQGAACGQAEGVRGGAQRGGRGGLGGGVVICQASW